jgi:rhamnose transport system ATP-binding protein
LFPKRKVPIGETVLEVKDLSRIGYFRNVSFNVRRGEIFGLSGLVGAGRSEVCQAICGITGADSGEVILNGKTCHFRHPSQSIKKSLGYLPEDRQLQGLILNWEIFKNQTLATIEKYSDLKGINVSKEWEQSAFLCEKLSIKAGSVFDKVSSLSGGNQQKVVLSKLLDSELKILIMDEPTKGVDVGAKAQIYGIMSDLVESGYAIVLVSSEMPEVLAMCDRVGIMCEGELKKIFDIDQVTQEEMLEVSMSSSSNVVKKEEVKA